MKMTTTTTTRMMTTITTTTIKNKIRSSRPMMHPHPGAGVIGARVMGWESWCGSLTTRVLGQGCIKFKGEISKVLVLYI